MPEEVGIGEEHPGRALGLLSVVTPMFNEELTAEEFYRRIREALADVPFELIVVDDGSTDATAAIVERIAAADPRVGVVTLSRNFGHQTALTAGLDHARGDAVVMIDSDLQDPPELIPAMVGHWRSGSDVVYGVRERRQGERWFKLATANWFYRLFKRLSKVDLTPDSGDFRLMDRQALDALVSMRERNRFIRGMTVWVGFTQTAIPYTRDARHAGETKYTLPRMVRFSFDALTSFSQAPLQLATVLGFFFAGLAFLAMPVAIAFRIAGEFVPGVTTTLLAVLLLGGIQLITVGIIGEYLGRVYDEVKGRPLYVVAGRRNLTEVQAGEQPAREDTVGAP